MASQTHRTACAVCRSRKVACDRQRPRCGLCVKNNFDCQYKAREYRPGLRAGYVSSLEKRIVDLEQRLDRLEHPRDESPLTPSLQQPLGTEIFNPSLPTANNYRASAPSDSDTRPHSLERPLQHPSPSATPTHYATPGTHLRQSLMSPMAHNEQEPVEHDRLAGDIDVRALWIAHYSPWFPIIHPTYFEQVDHASRGDSLLWKAITAAVVNRVESLTPNNQRAMSRHLQNQVTAQALGDLSLRSIQALLVICNLIYGDGDMVRFWNLVAVCRRMASQLGLRSISGTGHGNGPRSAALDLCANHTTNPIIAREECIRTYWMVEMLHIISATGSPHDCSPFSQPSADCILPCRESVWGLSESLDEPSLATTPYSSGFSLCIGLAINEVATVQSFLRTYIETRSFQGVMDWESQAQRLDERLTNWREEFVAAVFRLINAAEVKSEMDPYITLTNCILNTTLITLLQWRTPCPKGIETHVEPWSYATTRCIYACENLAAKISRMNEEQLNKCSPHLVFSIFAAARFYIIYTKALDADVPSNLRSLAFSLHICGRHWLLAERYEQVIRTAVSEHRSAVSDCTLPSEFYNPQLSTLEVSDLVQVWAKQSGS